MAITNLSNATILTNTQAAIAMRLHSDPDTEIGEPLNAIIERLTVTSAALIRKRTVNLPNNILVQAAIMLCTHLYDSPIGGLSNAWIRSGAFDLTRPWQRRRAGLI